MYNAEVEKNQGESDIETNNFPKKKLYVGATHQEFKSRYNFHKTLKQIISQRKNYMLEQHIKSSNQGIIFTSPI